ELTSLRSELCTERDRRSDAERQAAALTERLRAEQEAQQGAEERLSRWMESLGSSMLSNSSRELQRSAEGSLRALSEPLRVEFQHLNALILKQQEQSSAHDGALRAELERLQRSSQRLSDEAQGLTRALLHGSKSQGIWGEQQLGMLLEAAGLREGEDYRREVVTERDAEGRLRRPDVVVSLPGGRHLIIDSKCSLTDYVAALSAPEGSREREAALAAHCRSLRAHVQELTRARYQDAGKFNSPRFVLMFVPVDGALAVIPPEQRSLYQEAAQAGVFMVSPMSLLPALQTVGNLWMLSGQDQRLQELAREASALYAKAQRAIELFEVAHRRYVSLGTGMDDLSRALKGREGVAARLGRYTQRAAAEEPGATAAGPQAAANGDMG
ncbi:MAG: DNA recombination protein RmuC, partial [Succinivibrionaceae bacterium]|nr:DNA recombination protein RmuC [Succinivibrionaceae bacterium]